MTDLHKAQNSRQAELDEAWADWKARRESAGARARLKEIFKGMVVQLRSFDSCGDHVVWAAAKSTADDMLMSIEDLDCES